jgi:hypothetical protein
MSQNYVRLPLVIEAIKRELKISEVKHQITTNISKKGQEYKQVHFSRADNTPIVRFVYCKIFKDEPYVLAASFKDAMKTRDTIVADASVEEVVDLLF